MNIKKIAIKSMAPATAGAIILASGALSALASFVVSPTLPSPCVASYGYDAGYGYGYGYDTATCMNPIPPTAPILNGGAYVPSPIVYGSSSTPWDSGLTTDNPLDFNIDLSTWTATTTYGVVCDASSSSFNDESKAAYLYACVNNITTKRDIDDSIFYGMLIRKEMAKMISNYAMNVIGQSPDLSKSCTFGDIVGEDAEMKTYITLACQLGLMGYEADGQTQAANFNPNQSVDRGMFATLFSRMLYGNVNNVAIGSSNYSAKHLTALKDAGILNTILPTMTEIRGYVWIVFDRASTQ